MRTVTAATAAMMLVTTAPAFAGAAPTAVTMAQLVKGVDMYVGKQVVIGDCMIMSYNDIVGAQCSPAPLDPALLAYVDVDTMNAAAKKIGADCNTTDINKKCLVKVTGTVTKNSRGQALIKNATIEMVKFVPAT